MNGKMLPLLTLLMAAICQPTLAMADTHQPMDDLRYIRDWERNRIAGDLAAILNLDDGQITQLREYRAKVDAVNAEIQPRLDAARQAVEVEAARIRGHLENGGELTQTDKDKLKETRKAVRQIRKEKRLKMRLATLGMDDLLNSNQIQTLKDFLISKNFDRIRKHASKARAREANRGQRKRALNRAKYRVAKLLLSDGFLNSHP